MCRVYMFEGCAHTHRHNTQARALSHAGHTHTNTHTHTQRSSVGGRQRSRRKGRREMFQSTHPALPDTEHVVHASEPPFAALRAHAHCCGEGGVVLTAPRAMKRATMDRGAYVCTDVWQYACMHRTWRACLGPDAALRDAGKDAAHSIQPHGAAKTNLARDRVFTQGPSSLLKNVQPQQGKRKVGVLLPLLQLDAGHRRARSHYRYRV